MEYNSSDRIVEEFDRRVGLGRHGVASRPLAERVVYYVVATRCFIDIDGFASVYEQDLGREELALLVDGLNKIEESELAEEFRRGFEMLDAHGFDAHRNWNNVAESIKAEIDEIGKRIGDRLWDLDTKLAALLDATTERHPK